MIENPPHVDELRNRNIPVDELLAGFSIPGEPSSPDALRSYFAGPERRRLPREVTRWAEVMRGSAEATSAIEAANELLAAPPIDFTDRARGRSQLYGFHYLHWMECLIQAHALTSSPRYAVGFAEIFDRWYETRDLVHGDWPGLDVVWYSLGVEGRGAVIAQALLQFAEVEELSTATWTRMMATLVGGGRWLAEEHARFRPCNWQFGSVCGLLQLSALLSEHQDAAHWGRVARAGIEAHLTLDVYPDGGHYERAPAYHGRVLTLVQNAAVVAERHLDWRLANEPAFVAMHDWLVAMTTPGGWVPPFHDSSVVWTAKHLVVGQHLCRRPDWKELVERWLTPEQIRSILAWLPPRPGRGDPWDEFVALPARGGGQPRSSWLDGSRYAVLRTGWEASDLYLALNCGALIEHELESHSHRAVLDFVLSAWDQPLIWEAGGPINYDVENYQDWYQEAVAHSTVLVPGRSLDDDHEATLETFQALPEIDVVAASHGGWGIPHRRSVALVHAPGAAPYLLIEDQLEGAEEFVWIAHGRTAWDLSGDERCRSTGSPGVTIVSAGPGEVVERATRERLAGYPDAEHAERAFAPLHTLEARIRGEHLRTLFFPFKDRSDGELPEVKADAGGITICFADVEDRISGHRWVRRVDGTVVAAAAWSPAETTDLEALIGGSAVTAMSAGWQDGLIAATVVTSGRGMVWFRCPDARTVTVAGVEVPTDRGEGDRVAVRLPWAGRWDVRVSR